MILVVLSILTQLCGFILVNFVGVIDDQHTPLSIGPAETTTAPAETISQKQIAATYSATFWELVLNWVFPTAKFIAMVSALLAVLTIMFAVKLSLVGRLGGIPGFMSAFFWSLILLAAVTPWQQIIDGEFATGALYNMGELTQEVSRIKASWGADDVSIFDRILFYARFIAYPVIALLIWVAVMSKFARGYKGSIMAPVGTIGEQRPDEPAESVQ